MLNRKAYYVEEMFIAKKVVVNNGKKEISTDRKIIHIVWEPKRNFNKLERLVCYLKNELVPKYMIYPEEEEAIISEDMSNDGIYLCDCTSAFSELDDYYLSKGVLFDSDMKYFYNKINGVVEYDDCDKYLKKTYEVDKNTNQ